MKTRRAMPLILALVVVGLYLSTACGAEINGWVKREICRVVKQPGTRSTMVGIIIKTSPVTVENVGNGWGKIGSVPVLDSKTGKPIDGKRCWIRIGDLTTRPGQW